jgi:hypothetical protein
MEMSDMNPSQLSLCFKHRGFRHRASGQAPSIRSKRASVSSVPMQCIATNKAGPNKCIKVVRFAHATAQSLRAWASLYARR